MPFQRKQRRRTLKRERQGKAAGIQWSSHLDYVSTQVFALSVGVTSALKELPLPGSQGDALWDVPLWSASQGTWNDK